jgi:hypothetical protein
MSDITQAQREYLDKVREIIEIEEMMSEIRSRMTAAEKRQLADLLRAEGERDNLHAAALGAETDAMIARGVLTEETDAI